MEGEVAAADGCQAEHRALIAFLYTENRPVERAGEQPHHHQHRPHPKPCRFLGFVCHLVSERHPESRETEHSDKDYVKYPVAERICDYDAVGNDLEEQEIDKKEIADCRE